MMCLGKGDIGIVMRDDQALFLSFFSAFFERWVCAGIMLGFCGAGAMLETP